MFILKCITYWDRYIQRRTNTYTYTMEFSSSFYIYCHWQKYAMEYCDENKQLKHEINRKTTTQKMQRVCLEFELVKRQFQTNEYLASYKYDGNRAMTTDKIYNAMEIKL